MFPTSKGLHNVLSLLIGRDTRSRSKQELATPPRSSLTLETLNLDVLRLLILELQRTRTSSLRALASCSRTLRDIVSPILFYRYYFYPGHEAPPRLRTYIQHITLPCQLSASNAVWLEILLDTLPSLRAITFQKSPEIPWEVLGLVFSRPRVVSVTFSGCTIANPYPVERRSRTPISLTSLSYDTTLWKEWAGWDMEGGPRDLVAVFSREAKSMEALVPPTHNTMSHLTLPMQSAPILSMAELSWPNLRSISLIGRYVSSDQADSLPVLLSSLPSLRTLSLLIARRDNISRAPILGQHPSPSTVLSGLRALTLAYPDPEDSIFAIDTTHLLRLSLRDWPRHYTKFAFRNTYASYWSSPILSSDECLSILKRLDVHHLTSLELVYQAQSPVSDDALLSYIARTFPGLTYLELHRYRAQREDPLDYMHIVELVAAAAPHCRTIRLHLDFPDDHGPHCTMQPVRDAWFAKFKDDLGPAIVRALEERCPLLERVELLYHGVPTSTWVEFHPSRCAEPRFVMDQSDPELWDSPPVPHQWYKRLRRAPRRRQRRDAAPS